MEGCTCDHPASEHGAATHFETSMCLHMDCDCDGTRAEVAAMVARRTDVRNKELNALVATIREVLSNPMPRSIDDMARNIAAALIANYKVEAL